MSDIVFDKPGLLYLLLLLIPVITWYVFRQRTYSPVLNIPSFDFIKNTPWSYKRILRHVNFGILVLVMALLVIVIARPQSSNKWEKMTTQGIDIVITLDISSSMLAEDFRPNRLEAAKTDAVDFIKGRPDDRIGLVVFSGESFTQCPITTDHTVLTNLIGEIKCGMIEDGTAIGMGLANAVNRLKDSDARSRVIILLTDGENNKGEIDPLTAAEIASSFGVRVYTIGVGTMGMAPYPFQTPYGINYQNVEVKIDEPLLMKIASMTQGQYFRATNNQRLKEVYKEIDKLEKSRIEVTEYSRKNEEFEPFLTAALILFVVWALIRFIVLRNIP